MSGFRQHEFVHIADAMLCCGCSRSPKDDNSWLGVHADVWRGRRFLKHSWHAPAGSRGKFAVVHFASNDFKSSKGASVAQCLDESFWDAFKQKMLLLRGETKGVFLVIWGDYKLWALGFKDGQKAFAAERYDGICAEMLERASQLYIPARWLRFEDLAALEHPPNDSLHFARSSASKLQGLLNKCWIRGSSVSLSRFTRTDRFRRGPRRLCAHPNNAGSCCRDPCLRNTASPRRHLLHQGRH